MSHVLHQETDKPKPYHERNTPLSGWDVGYAIKFSETNKAIAHYQGDLLKKIESERMSYDFGLGSGMWVKISAEYKNWAVIGSETGDKIGMLVELSNLKVFEQKLKLYDPEQHTTISPDDIIIVTVEDERLECIRDNAPNEYQFKRNVGVTLAMSLHWYESLDGIHELKVKNSDGEIKLEDKIIRHPSDIFRVKDHPKQVAFDINGNSTGSIHARLALGDALVQDALKEFDFVFATIDYTQTAEEKANWLHLTTHEHSVTTYAKKAADELPKDATEEDEYEYYLNPDKGYNPGGIMIFGMTDHREKPPSKPVIMNIIPEGCDAGYAYSDTLIIRHLIYDHLKEIYSVAGKDDDEHFFLDADCFAYSSEGNLLTNTKRLRVKELTTLDYGFIGYHPDVVEYIEKGHLAIAVEYGRIRYSITTNFVVPKGVLGWGLPYNCDVKNRMTLVFDYSIEEILTSKFRFEKVAILQFSNYDKEITVSPSREKENGWVMFFSALAEGVVMALLTVGTMWALSRGASFARDKVKRKPQTSVVEPGEESKSIPFEESSQVEDYAKERSEAHTELENSGKMFSEDCVKKMAPVERADGKKTVSSQNTMARTVGHLLYFVLVQTSWDTVKKIVDSNKLADLEKEDLSVLFKGFISNAITRITWGSQDKSAFEIKEGGLTQGGFLIGLDLKFKHDKPEA